MERNLTMIALFAALIAALGLIPKFTLGFGVPITAQSLGVMLCGTVVLPHCCSWHWWRLVCRFWPEAVAVWASLPRRPWVSSLASRSVPL